jgi:hypothetical protein
MPPLTRSKSRRDMLKADASYRPNFKRRLTADREKSAEMVLVLVLDPNFDYENDDEGRAAERGTSRPAAIRKRQPTKVFSQAPPASKSLRAGTSRAPLVVSRRAHGETQLWIGVDEGRAYELGISIRVGD